MWFDYIKEREGKESIVIPDKGFLLYKIFEDTLYISDIYTAPEHRGNKITHELTSLAVEVAKNNGCSSLTGSVDTSLPGATRSVRLQIEYGFKIVSASPNWIVLTKEI